MKTLLILALGSTMLSGCANALMVAGALGEGMAEADQANSGMQQQTQAILNQAQTYQAPAVMDPSQPNSTAIVYCRDLSGQIIACKQLN